MYTENGDLVACLVIALDHGFALDLGSSVALVLA